MWKRHELLKSKIGVFPDEEISFENVNSIFYAVVGLIPTLTFLEIILYCLYQCKVSETETLNFELFTIYIKFHPWREILANEEVECNENQENVKIKTLLYCLFQHKVSKPFLVNFRSTNHLCSVSFSSMEEDCCKRRKERRRR